MKKILKYLGAHPLLNVGLALAYFLAVTLPHEQVGLWTVPIRESLGWDRYNLLLLAMSGVALLVLLIFLGKNLRQNEVNRRKFLTYLVAAVLLTAASFRWLVIINIEAVHFGQYAVMAILLFPLVRRFGETLFWVTLLGTLDEAYQYFVLAPHRTNYFDLNDVILNLLGGVFGLLLVASLGKIFQVERKRLWFQSPVFFATILIAVGLSISFANSWLYIQPAEGQGALWALIREPQVGLWTTVHPGFTFHVVQPLEGVIIVVILLMFFSGIGDVNTFRK